MTEKEQLSKKIKDKKAQISTTKSKLKTVKTKLNGVQSAKKAIAKLKEKTSNQSTALVRVDCSDTTFWGGLLSSRAISDYSQGKKETRTYYSGIEDLADDLARKEKSFLNTQKSWNSTLSTQEKALASLQKEYNALK